MYGRALVLTYERSTSTPSRLRTLSADTRGASAIRGQPPAGSSMRIQGFTVVFCDPCGTPVRRPEAVSQRPDGLLGSCPIQGYELGMLALTHWLLSREIVYRGKRDLL
jgi:hypothetical protein